MNVTVFEAINITKKYRNTLALNQVSMSVMQGDIYGFIGENGAGKTTMIRLLTGLAEPTTGKIALFGESNKKLAKQRDRIGCIIESPSLYLDMTAYENLEVQRLQRGIPGKGCIDNALALVGLKDTGKKKAKDFSLGMRQRLALAIALLGNPEFLVNQVKQFVDASNVIFGEYMCQGRMPQSVRERYLKMKEAPDHPANLDVLIQNFDCALSHPDADDLERLRQAVRNSSF